MMNKIYYWLSRNYYIWLVYMLTLLPVVELCNDLIDEFKRMKNHWESEKSKMEQRMKKGQ